MFGNLDDLRQAQVVDTPLYSLPFSDDINQPRQEVRHDLIKGSVRYTGKNHSLKLQYDNQINRRQEFGVRRGDAPNIDLELRTQSVDLDWNHPDLGPVSGKIGVQWLQKANDNQPGTNTVPFIPNYDEERLGIYLIESLSVGKGLLEAGIRYDQLESEITGREPDNTIYRNTILYRNLSGTIGWEHPVGKKGSCRALIPIWRDPRTPNV